MNILEQEDIIKGLPDQALMQEAQRPSGELPQYLVVSEIQRRSDMRKRYKAEQEQMPQGTVKDKVMQEGIMASMPPQMAMAPQMAQRMPNMPPPQMPPQGIEQAMPPQMMFGGGVIRMDEGRQAQSGLNLDPLRERLGALGDTVKDIESSNRQTDSSGNVLRSVKGAVGLMQVMPATAAQPGYNVPSIFDLARRAGIEVNEDQVTFDREVLEDGKIKITPTAEAISEADRLLENPRLNEAIGLRYLEAMVDEFDGDLDRIGIAYNAGPKVAERWDGNPESLIKETRDYIAKIKGSEDVVNARDSLVGLEQQDTPAEGSPEAQARVVEAIQRRRAERPPRSAEEQLLDMAGGRPMPVVGQGAPRESVSVMPLPQPPAVSLDNTFDPTMAAPNISMPSLPPAPPPQPELSFVTPQEGPRERRESAQRGMDMMLDQLDQNDRQRRIGAVSELSKLYQDMGLNPTQASNLALGIGPRGSASPFGAPPADRSGVATLPVDLGIGPDGPVRYPFGAPAPDKSGVTALPVDLGIGPDGPVRYPFGRPTESGVATLSNDQQAIERQMDNIDAMTSNNYTGEFSSIPAPTSNNSSIASAIREEVLNAPLGRFNREASQRIADAYKDVGIGAAIGQTGREILYSPIPLAEHIYETGVKPIAGALGQGFTYAAQSPPIAGAGEALDQFVTGSTEDPLTLGDIFGNKDASVQGESKIQTQSINERLNIGPEGPVTNVFGTSGSGAGRFGGLTSPDANGATPETKILDALANVPSGDRSNPEYSLDELMNPTDEMLARLSPPTLSPRELDKNLGLEPEKTTPVTPPEFNITDILDESRRMNKANILMQLGAGIAAGDVSKGLSAAGAAAASGAKEIRDLDMRSRLAKFQAGREDQKRETAASQFDRQMTLLEEKVKNAAEYGGAARDAAFIRVVGDDLERARDALKIIDPQKYPVEYRKAMARIKTLEETLYGVAGIGMPTVGTGDTGGVGGVGGAGITDFKDVTGSQAIVGG